MFPGCPASRAPRGSTLALLCCQGSAGSVGGLWSRIQASVGFWLGLLRFGLPGQQLILPRRQSQASSCYESHIVWPGSDRGGGSQEHWGASNYSPWLNPPSGPPGPCPLPQHIFSSSSPFGAENGGCTGRGSWKEAVEERAEKTDKQRKEAGKWEDKREIGGREREEGRKRGGAREAEKEREGPRTQRKSSQPLPLALSRRKKLNP